MGWFRIDIMTATNRNDSTAQSRMRNATWFDVSFKSARWQTQE